MTVVYVFENGAIRHHTVQPGPRDPTTGMVAVLEGLSAGDRVVITPTVEVADGTPAELDANAPAGEPVGEG
jgi:hypothetical protein